MRRSHGGPRGYDDEIVLLAAARSANAGVAFRRAGLRSPLSLVQPGRLSSEPSPGTSPRLAWVSGLVSLVAALGTCLYRQMVVRTQLDLT